MKFSIGLTTFTLLLATAIVEATWLDAAAHKRHAAHVNARDVTHRAGKRCKPRPSGHSSSIHHTSPTPTHPASSPTPKVPTKDSAPKPSSSSQKPPVQTPAHEASGVIRVSSGQCGSAGASSTSREAFVGRRVDLTTVIISESHKNKGPQRRH